MEPILCYRGELLYVACPYRPQFPPAARSLGGCWAGGVWSFPARRLYEVRDLLEEIYGKLFETQELVDARITLRGQRLTCGYYSVCARGIEAMAHDREDPWVHFDLGVTLVEGQISARKYKTRRRPTLIIGDRAIVEVADVSRRDVPSPRINKGVQHVEILRVGDRRALAAERDRLWRRICEIDRLLAHDDGAASTGCPEGRRLRVIDLEDPNSAEPNGKQERNRVHRLAVARRIARLDPAEQLEIWKAETRCKRPTMYRYLREVRPCEF